MRQIKVGIYIPDEIYRKRMVNYLMRRHGQQFLLESFTSPEAVQERVLAAGASGLKALVASDCGREIALLKEILSGIGGKVLYLMDSPEEEGDYPPEDQGLEYLEKYKDMDILVERLQKTAGDELLVMKKSAGSSGRTRILGVYSLSECGYQLPIAVTMGSILQEGGKVLLVDFQENSGLSLLACGEIRDGLEEILVMAESGRFSVNRIRSCIGHMDQIDYIYPPECGELLCEVNAENLQRLLRLMEQELDYEIILINFGGRFPAFFPIMEACSKIYLIQKKGGVALWREQAFYQELRERGLTRLESVIVPLEIPVITGGNISCEKLINQWKWTELGNQIRKQISMEDS